jgi:hypothetical protein
VNSDPLAVRATRGHLMFPKLGRVVTNNAARVARRPATALRGGARPPQPPRRLHAVIAPGLLPRTVQLCIRCRENPAGFWVSRKNAEVVHRPWCLSCCQRLDQGSYDVTPFGG